jgi:tetratricopeptide (TPR) repeat protein
MHPLDDKIATLEQELSVVHNEEQRVPTLCDLVSTYDKRFLNTKNVSDRQTATIYGYEAIASIPKHDFRRPQLFTALISMQHDVIFGNSIGPDLGELEEAISFSEDALELIKHCHGAAEQAQVLMCLSDFLHARFHLSDADDAINDLNKSIALAQTALQTQPGNPRISCLVVRRLLKRHSVVGDYWDAELAVRYSEDASMADPENPRLLETVSDALQARHLSTKSHRDLDEAISRLETALALPDLHAQHRLTLLEKLEVAKELHEARIGEGIGQSTEDLTAAIAQLSVEVSQSTPSGLSLLRSLTKLANICLLKASRTQDPNDLEIAYEYTSQTLQRTPRSHPQFAILIVKLGKIWMERGNLTRDPEFQEKCRAEAHNAFLHAAKQPSQPPLERVECFRAVAELAMERGEWDHPSWCLQRAMEMLPLVAWHTLLLEDLEFVLRRVSGIAALGAASFLTGGHACAHNALAQVELGRGMIFSLITGTRMDVSSLREKDPGTYAEYESLRGTSAISKPIKVITMDDIRVAIEAAGIHLPQGSGGSWQLENTSGVQRPQGLPSTAVALPPQRPLQKGGLKSLPWKRVLNVPQQP